ncbi:uncharacterized protein L3040_009110 [Drepanopeziza brunnea f. sp. 'multigermtubi']|uniref:AT hook motif family protein n=1 Tax=Marssonina brunnea f. sp. multigermtubi (strain MB_m1) TaxID=1072389 RepID=K1WT10_MARBU|nr:AT hook motif family protein [Drepanopeziza brunnea f. sp. 'multigermtubi' MB_m1]EKD15562.1 AT hook motif family protein [Drepanopeziza brunnea f. sp. 'multigermtubi' MB_m1]KAJ5032508.1 hypothetical protein L3040_009110 [Drepanopeziza brunnea f. sp. 'multigermtubi']
MAPRAPTSPSPGGSYMIDCEVVERGCLEQAEDLGLDMRRTTEPGVFEADFDFDFGILEGMVIMRTEENILKLHCSRLDRNAGAGEEDDSEEDGDGEESEEDEDEDEDRKPTASSERKVGGSTGREAAQKSPR